MWRVLERRGVAEPLVYSSTRHSATYLISPNMLENCVYFCYNDFKSEYNGVKIKYSENQLVNVGCTSIYGTVKAIEAFYGDVDCSKKIIINAAHSIKLISGE